MRDITITANDAGRRLDRFLRKYLRNASLGEIYKLIRKDVKVDGRRRNESYMLNEGEVLTLYISDEVLASLTGEGSAGRAGSGKTRSASSSGKAKRQFRIIYEDDKVLIVSKPYGLLTHGDSHEKKNHLANQVRDYLIEKGEYDPRSEKVFSPAPANRLDRNTTGLVLFGKTSAALKALNEAIREGIRGHPHGYKAGDRQISSDKSSPCRYRTSSCRRCQVRPRNERRLSSRVRNRSGIAEGCRQYK